MKALTASSIGAGPTGGGAAVDGDSRASSLVDKSPIWAMSFSMSLSEAGSTSDRAAPESRGEEAAELASEAGLAAKVTEEEAEGDAVDDEDLQGRVHPSQTKKRRTARAKSGTSMRPFS